MASKNPPVSYGSHLPALIRAVMLTDGPVLEMGMGYNSSFTLHWLCASTLRLLVSYEDNPEWLKFAWQFEQPWHKIYPVADKDAWAKLDIERPWDVALIDFDPARRRWTAAVRLAPFVKYLVLHDTQSEYERRTRFYRIWAAYKYRWDYKICEPHTAVLSNLVDLTGFSV